ncbi:hypothetical protein HG531_010127 [Fusarium graminearum]|nr:hypothetical protein HG531_010127 [Fusarium graminearum]
MVNSNRKVVTKLTEELATVGDGVVEVARNLDGLSLLLLNKPLDVLLGLGHMLGSTSQLDAGLAITLSGNINGDGELGLKLALGVTTTTNEGAVVLNGNVYNLSDLVLTLANNLLDALDNLVHNVSAALNLDCVTISLLLGELDGAGELSSVVRATSLDNNIPEVGACQNYTDERLVVLLVDVESANHSVVEHGPLLLENLLGFGDLLCRSREEDVDLVASLQTVDLASLSANQLPVVLGVDLKRVCCLICQCTGETLDVGASSLGLGLGSLELDLAILNLNLNIEAVSKFTDVAATLTNQVVSEFLREVKRQGESTLLLILLLLLNEGVSLGGKRLHSRLRAAKSDGCSDLGNTDGDLVGLSAFLLLLDESAKSLVEFGRDIESGSGDSFLLVDKIKNVLLSFFQVRALENKENGNVALRGLRHDNLDTIVALDLSSNVVTEMLVEERINGNGDHARRRLGVDNTSNLRLRTNSVLTLTRVKLPGESTTFGERSVDVSSNVTSVDSSTTRGAAVESSNVQVGHLHAHCQIHSPLQTGVNLVSRSNYGDSVVILVGGQQDGTTSISEELVNRNTSVTDDELVTATLDSELFGGELLVELGNLTLDLGADLLDSSTITSKLDVALVVASRSENGRLSLGQSILAASNEGVESGGDAPNLGLDIGRSFASDLENLISSRSSRKGIALNGDINGSIVILLIDGVVLVDLGKLNLGTGLLLEGLDHGTSLADDVGTSRLGNGNFDGSSGTDLSNKVLKRLLSNILRTSGIKLVAAVGRSSHCDVGTRPTVNIFDDVGNGPLQLATSHDVLRIQSDSLDIATRDYHRLVGSNSSRGRSRRTRAAVGGGAVSCLSSPDGRHVGGLALGSTKLGEQLMRLSIESLGSRLGGCLGSRSGSFGRARGLGRRTDREVLIRYILDDDMVGSLSMLLHELLSSRELTGRSFGRHCEKLYSGR